MALTRNPFNLTVNYVLVIEWLPKGEHQTGELLCKHFNADADTPVSFELVKCNQASDVLLALDVAVQRARNGEVPLIQIEAHGFPRTGRESGGIEGPGLESPEQILWEKLWSKFREINTASGYKLVVAAAACHGSDAKWGIAQELLLRFDGRPETVPPVPFMGTLGFASNVFNSSLLRAFVRFYQVLFRGDTPEEACLQANRRTYAREKMVWISSSDIVRNAISSVRRGRRRADARAKWHQFQLEAESRRPWRIFRMELLALERQNIDIVGRGLLPV